MEKLLKKPEEEFVHIVKDVEKHVKKYDEYYECYNWFAGITNDFEETKKDLEKRAKVQHFERWDLKTKENAESFRNYLREKLEFRSMVENENTEYKFKTVMFKVMDETVDEIIEEDSKYVFVFKNK